MTKLLLLAAVVAALWYGLRAWRRWDAKRLAEAERRGLQAGTQAMVKCPVCGAYNPAGVPCSHRS